MTERLHFDFSLSHMGEGNGSPLQYSCLENPTDRGACWAAVYGVTQSWIWLTRFSSSSKLLPSSISVYLNFSLEKAMATHSSTLAWRIPWMEEPGALQSMGSLRSDTTERLHFHSLEKEMATHSSVLAWRIPGMGEPDGLPSMGSHRVGHD